MQCPNCGHEYLDGSKFCSECGNNLTKAPSQASPVFFQTEQEVQKQNNVAGNYYDQRQIVVMSSEPPVCPDPADAMSCYLSHVIESNRRLPLQGIRSSSGLVSIELEEIYVTLTATTRKSVINENDEIETEAHLVSDEMQRLDRQKSVQKVAMKVQEALGLYSRLVVLGDPGSGKTTLLRYLALTYARDWQQARPVKERLGLDERRLPIFLPLRDFARNLEKEHPDNGADGPKLLLDYLQIYSENQQLVLPMNFFTERLKAGECIVLLDGMDEVASMATRQRIARIVERFTVAYPQNRYVVTSRIVGYTGGARLGEDYEITTVQDFTDENIACFVRYWNKAVEVTLAGEATEYVLQEAERQAKSLIEAIRGNGRVRELAVNPLLLTVIALVHRYRAQLPERRVELYEEALEVLLAQWDAVKGLSATTILQGVELDAGDRRSLLEPVALWMMEQRIREIELDDLRRQLMPAFQRMLKDERQIEKAVNGFVALINERSGLLTERGQGIYAFNHLTFQEHLAARVVADRKDYLEYTLERLGDSWWREVILLEVGYLSTQGKKRVTELIRAIMEYGKEPEPYYNFILAAEAIRDVGILRLDGDLDSEIRRRLQKNFETPLIRSTVVNSRPLIQRRAVAVEALERIKGGGFGAQPAFWRWPYGEPVWCEIPSGEFWMGSNELEENEEPIHRVYLNRYWIAKTPITNAQYQVFVEATKYQCPGDWERQQPPKGKLNHPVVNVSWHDAMAYCEWLSKTTQKSITLPSEAEWEKAARGNQDKRDYPWGRWSEGRANTSELGLKDTTPVGIFPEGMSPYGCLDMIGNVWEWTQQNSGNEDGYPHVVRGGAFYSNKTHARNSYRGFHDHPLRFFGFRVLTILS